MKKGKIAALCGMLIMCCLVAVRIYNVNKDAFVIPISYYSRDDVVDLSTGTGDEIDKKLEGYTIEVGDTQLLTAETFMERYQMEQPDGAAIPDYYYLVDTTFCNHHTEDDNSYGVGLYNILLYGKNYYFLVNSDAFFAVNPNMNDMMSFSLRGDTEMSMTLVYGITDNAKVTEDILENLQGLLVTMAPVRKIIQF